MIDPTGKTNSHDQFDYQRSYVLPAHVVSNIPRERSHLVGYRAHEYSRGLLVEIARSIEARPDELRYTDCEAACSRHPVLCPNPTPCPTRTSSLAVAYLALPLPWLEPLVVTVNWWHSCYDDSDRHQGWRLTIDGDSISEENRIYSPSPVYTGALVRWHARRAPPAWCSPAPGRLRQASRCRGRDEHVGHRSRARGRDARRDRWRHLGVRQLRSSGRCRRSGTGATRLRPWQRGTCDAPGGTPGARYGSSSSPRRSASSATPTPRRSTNVSVRKARSTMPRSWRWLDAAPTCCGPWSATGSCTVSILRAGADRGSRPLPEHGRVNRGTARGPSLQGRAGRVDQAHTLRGA